MIGEKKRSLTFERHDRRREAPREFFESIERRFNDRLQCAGKIELWIGEKIKGTHHRKGVKISRLTGRFIEGVCQPGDNDTCFHFRAQIHSPLKPAEVHAKVSAAEEKTTPSRVVVSISKPEAKLDPSSFWNEHHLDLVVQLMDVKDQHDRLIPSKEVATAIICVIEDSSAVKAPSEELVHDAMKRLTLGERLFPFSTDGKAITHFTLTKVASPAAIKSVAAASKNPVEPPAPQAVPSAGFPEPPSNPVAANAAEGSEQAAQAQIVDQGAAPAASPTTSETEQRGTFGDLFQNPDKLAALEAELVAEADPSTATISHLTTLNVFCRYLQKIGIDPGTIENRRIGGGFSQLVRRKVLQQLGEPHQHRGYVVLKKLEAINKAKRTQRPLGDPDPLTTKRRKEILERLTADEGLASIGEGLLKASNETEGFLTHTLYWQRLRREIEIFSKEEEVVNVVHGALTSRRFVQGGNKPQLGVGYQLQGTLQDLVTEYQAIWKERIAAQEQEELERRNGALARSPAASSEPAVNPIKPETRATNGEVPRPKRLAITPPRTPDPQDKTIDDSLAEIDREMAELEARKQRLVQTRVVGEVLKDNPKAAEAVKQMIATGDMEGLKKLLNLG